MAETIGSNLWVTRLVENQDLKKVIARELLELTPKRESLKVPGKVLSLIIVPSQEIKKAAKASLLDVVNLDELDEDLRGRIEASKLSLPVTAQTLAVVDYKTRHNSKEITDTGVSITYPHEYPNIQLEYQVLTHLIDSFMQYPHHWPVYKPAIKMINGNLGDGEYRKRRKERLEGRLPKKIDLSPVRIERNSR